MRLRTKIFSVFIISLILSVVGFLITTAYLIEYGAWQGISTKDMNQALDEAVQQLSMKEALDKETIMPILEMCAAQYEGMEMEVISKEGSLQITTAPTQQIKSMQELIEDLSQHGVYLQEKWVVAKELSYLNGETIYVISIVPKEHFLVLSWSINGDRGIGVIRTIVLGGIGITLVVSSVFAFIFTRGILKRFTNLYQGMAHFELENTQVVIEDTHKDEIGELAQTFNRMAYKIKAQVKEEKEQESRRRELVSNISHDLRTPLASIIGYAESLKDGVYDNEEEQKKYLGIVYKKALYIEKLLKELLEFSRVDCGTLHLNKQEVDLSECTRELLIEYLPILEEKEIELITNIEEETIIATIDKDRISRVIRNLIDNAIKYGATGKTIKVVLKTCQNEVQLAVVDQGNGMSQEELKHIFKRFYRGDKSRGTKDGGMGLGLAIVEEIIKRHQGKIKVESQKGKGTSIMITLPLK